MFNDYFSRFSGLEYTEKAVIITSFQEQKAAKPHRLKFMSQVQVPTAFNELEAVCV